MWRYLWLFHHLSICSSFSLPIYLSTFPHIIVCADQWCYYHQATGEDFSVEPAETRRPFRALLDVGLVRTTTGNRVFGALKVKYSNLYHMLVPCYLRIAYTL